MDLKTRVRGPGRTTKEDWINTALHTLINEGVEQVKVLTLANKLNCARSSFYWYFRDRSDLLRALLQHWSSHNTQILIEATEKPADTITLALAQLYDVWLREGNFNTALDFAIRDWARRDAKIKKDVQQNDIMLIDSITQIFLNHSFAPDEAGVRARMVYYTPIGYDTLDHGESWETRASRIRLYLHCMTGIEPSDTEVNYLISVRDIPKQELESA
ncbi:MAG: TetR/AcrR family transcriptional regulator [Granulosicoccus sp.]